MKLLLGLFLGALGVSAGGIYVLKIYESPKPSVREEPPARRMKLAALFNEAKDHMRARRWNEARGLLLELQLNAPEWPSLRDYLARVETEIPNQEHLTAARAALAAHQLARAKAALDKVSSDTVMHEQVRSMRNELRQAADSRTHWARQLLDAGQREEARVIAQEVLAVFPDHPAAQRLEHEGTQVRTSCELMPPPADPGPQPAEATWHQARTRFIAGDQLVAVALAKQCASRLPMCKSGLKDMAAFGKLFARVEALNEKGLKHLLDLDRKITGECGPSHQARTVSMRAANVFYKNASAARAAGQWARAGEFAQRTLQVAPGHPGAAHILAEMRAKAKEMYLGLFSHHQFENDPDEALPILREILAMTPPEDELHQKVKKWLDTLSR